MVASSALAPLALATAALVGAVAEATTYVVLVDATGSEEGRLDDTNRQILGWADPSPERSLLQRGDRLLVIPIRSPGALDANYPALFNAEYPSNQLDRYSFFTGLRERPAGRGRRGARHRPERLAANRLPLPSSESTTSGC